MNKEDILGKVIKFISDFMMKKEVEIVVPLTVEPSTPEPDSIPEPVPSVPTFPKYVLTHTRFCADGIFGELKKEDGTFVAYTLEHSYDNKPKLVDGVYNCLRGPHRLHGMTEDFTTFEVKGVPNFNDLPVTGILFHWGNYNKDSEGCVLLGSTETPTMVGNSKNEWTTFMEMLEGFNNFELTVISQK